MPKKKEGVLTGSLTKDEKKNITAKLRKSDLFEEHQYSYMLYPNSKLPAFKNNNNISENEISGLEKLIEKTGNTILRQDKNGNYHFNPFFRNADTMKEYLAKLDTGILTPWAFVTKICSKSAN